MPFRVPSATAGRFTPDPQVIAAVRGASASSGASFDTLLASAAMESGLNPSAKATTSSASGLFQFTDQTWLSTVRQYGAANGLPAEASSIISQDGQLTVADPAARQRILNLRFDPSISSAMAGNHLRALATAVGAGIGHAPDVAETYLGHFLGSSGATQMLQAAANTPNRLAADVLPDAARANSAAFSANGVPRTAAQFVQHVRDRVAQAFTDIGAAMPAGAVSFAPAGSVGATSGTGHGLAIARASATPAERTMAASLIDVFSRLDRGEGSAKSAHGKRDHGLPLGLVSALASAPPEA